MSKDKRYFRKVDHQPLREGVTSSIYLDTPTYELWCESAAADNVIWEGDVPRFKNDTEKRDDLLPQADQLQNKLTDAAIASGIEWAGVQFYLTLENQFNFKALYDNAKDALITYPYKIWSGLSSTQLDDLQEVTEFYAKGETHKVTCLNEGFAQKQAFRNMSYDALKQWTDDNQSI